MQTKISVVIPTYKRPMLLTNCLIALTQQNMNKEDFEVIVVSDGQDSETLVTLITWLKKKKIQLTYLQTETKKGPAAARNLGWRMAKSSVIAFTDDDCLPDKNWLTALLKNFPENQPIAVTGQTKVPLPEKPNDFALNTLHLQYADFITANCACTKSILIQLDGFDERFRMPWREDSDLHFRLLQTGITLKKAEEAIVVHPVREAIWGVSLKEQKKGLYDALLFRKFPGLYRSHIESRPNWNYYLINLLWIGLILSILLKHKYSLIFCCTALTFLLLSFITKRLKHSRKSPGHILEMTLTSILIPTISIYWRIYGSIKYKVLFI